MIRISTLACILLASIVLVSAEETTNAASTKVMEPTSAVMTTKAAETTMAEKTTEKETTAAEKTTQKADTTAAEKTTQKADTTAAETTTKAETTTAAPMTTTMAPTPSEDAGTFVVMQNGTACVVMTAKVFNLTIKCEKDNMEQTFEINSNHTTVSGLCESSYDLMTLTDNKGRFVVSLNFTEIGSNYHIGNVDVKDANCEYMSSDIKTDLRSPKANVYRCYAQQKIVVNENSTLTLQGIRLQAFRNKGNSTSLDGTEYICMEDSSVSNVVPIAVGCALAGLIIIVLIAYIIGRLRRRPYEPV